MSVFGFNPSPSIYLGDMERVLEIDNDIHGGTSRVTPTNTDEILQKFIIGAIPTPKKTEASIETQPNAAQSQVKVEQKPQIQRPVNQKPSVQSVNTQASRVDADFEKSYQDERADELRKFIAEQKAEAERLKAETDKLQAERTRAEAETAKLRAEAERARLEAEQLRQKAAEEARLAEQTRIEQENKLREEREAMRRRAEQEQALLRQQQIEMEQKLEQQRQRELEMKLQAEREKTARLEAERKAMEEANKKAEEEQRQAELLKIQEERRKLEQDRLAAERAKEDAKNKRLRMIKELMEQRNQAKAQSQAKAQAQPAKSITYYDNLEAEALYAEVKQFIISKGLNKQLINKNILDEQFGKNNIHRLIVKSFLVNIPGKGVTFGNV